jgi:hypothetical protein
MVGQGITQIYGKSVRAPQASMIERSASRVITRLVDGLLTGFEPVLNVLSVIAKLLSLMIMPLINLFIPAMLPFIRLMTPMVAMMFKLLMPMYGWLMKEQKKISAPVTATGAALGAGIGTLLGPFGMVLGAIFGPIVLQFLIDFVNAVRDKVIDLLKTIKLPGIPSLADIAGQVKLFVDKIKSLFDGIKIPNIPEILTTNAAKLVPAVREIYNSVTGVVNKLLKTLGIDFKIPDFDTTIKIISDALTGIVNAMSDIFNKVKEYIHAAWSTVTDARIWQGKDASSIFNEYLQQYQKEDAAAKAARTGGGIGSTTTNTIINNNITNNMTLNPFTSREVTPAQIGEQVINAIKQYFNQGYVSGGMRQGGR